MDNGQERLRERNPVAAELERMGELQVGEKMEQTGELQKGLELEQTGERQGTPELEQVKGPEGELIKELESEIEAAGPLGGVETAGQVASKTDGVVALQEEEGPRAAKDGHALEKEWAETVEETLLKNRDDPREKMIKINQRKAEYLWKRFGRRLGDRN